MKPVVDGGVAGVSRRALAAVWALLGRASLRRRGRPRQGNQGGASDRERALAERYKPLLVLYPEIASETRKVRPRWRESGEAPLYEDYHPRDVRLVLDHARIPGRRPPHDGVCLLEDLQRDASVERIDLLAGAGHADRDNFWAEYYRIVHNIGGHDHGTYPPTAYAHIVHGDNLPRATDPTGNSLPYRGLVAIDYWFVYLYNDWRLTHEGDWEHVVVFLRRRSGSDGPLEPVACAYSAHYGGYRLPWRYVEKVDDRRVRSAAATHPVAYVANGSHANYFFGPGPYPTHTEQFGVRIQSDNFPFTGKFTDFTTSIEEGVPVLPKVEVVPEPVDGRWSGEWRWLNFRGRWGSLGVPWWLSWLPPALRPGPIQRIWGAPRSLPARKNWRDPFEWADGECEEAPPLGSWLSRQEW